MRMDPKKSMSIRFTKNRRTRTVEPEIEPKLEVVTGFEPMYMDLQSDA